MQIRVAPSLKKMIERAAVDEGRTLSGLIVYLASEHLKAKGYIDGSGKPVKRKR